jgi:putative flippase GtrA
MINKDLLRNIYLYILIGGAASISNYICFIALINLNSSIYINNAVATCIGVIISFTLNRKYNFRVIDKKRERFLKFILISSINYIFSTWFIYIFNNYGVNLWMAKLISMAMIVVYQFIFVNFWVFSKTTKN